MRGQLSIFDWMPETQVEPDAGEWVTEHGAIICAVMRRSYIGKKVVMDKSTSSMTGYQVGILEAVVESKYYDARNERWVKCDRSIVNDGSRNRNYVDHRPGIEIYECLPWDAYPERNKAIGGKL